MHRPSMHRLSGPLPRHAASPSHATWQGPVPLLQNSRTLVPRMVIRSGVLSRRKLPVRELLANSVSVASEGEQSDTAGRLFPVTQMGNRQRPVHRSASAASVAGLSAWAEHVSTIPHATTTASQQLRIVILRVPLRKKQPAPRLNAIAAQGQQRERRGRLASPSHTEGEAVNECLARIPDHDSAALLRLSLIHI